MYVILIYDIKQVNNFSRVQKKVFNICKKYLYHIQNSVFEGELSKSQLIKLKLELKKYIRLNHDSVIIFMSRNNRWMIKEVLTNQKNENHQFI